MVFVVVGGVWEYCFSILKCCGLILGAGREGGRGRARAHRWAAARPHARLAIAPNLVPVAPVAPVAPKIRVAFFFNESFFFCKCNVIIL